MIIGKYDDRFNWLVRKICNDNAICEALFTEISLSKGLLSPRTNGLPPDPVKGASQHFFHLFLKFLFEKIDD